MVSVFQNTFYLAGFFYFLSWISCLFNRKRISSVCLGIGLALNVLSAISRYAYAWPLLPMFHGPFFLPLFIGALSYKAILKNKSESFLYISLICFLALSAAFFPKDFYLPFLHSKTIFSHLFFLLGVIAKACFFIAAVQAARYLLGNYRFEKEERPQNGVLITRWIMWGFAFWTVSMFCGEIWSYLGWGSPLVWDDPAIITTIATWFYYACFLHLHLIKTWNIKNRALLALTGALLVFFFNCCTEMSTFQVPNTEWLIF